jgi:hypothetical protein
MRQISFDDIKLKQLLRFNVLSKQNSKKFGAIKKQKQNHHNILGLGMWLSGTALSLTYMRPCVQYPVP